MKKVNKKTTTKKTTTKKTTTKNASANNNTNANVNSFCVFGETLFPERTAWFKHLGLYTGRELLAFQTVFDMFVKRMSQHEQTRNNNEDENNANKQQFSFGDIVEAATLAYAVGGIIGEYKGSDILSELNRIKTKFDQLNAKIKAEKEAAKKKAENSVKVIEGKSADEILAKITDEIRAALEKNVSVN